MRGRFRRGARRPPGRRPRHQTVRTDHL